MNPIQHRRALINDPEIPVTFIEWLWANQPIWQAFCAQALKVIAQGRDHYSSKTILEYLRHETLLQEDSTSHWKLNNNNTAYLARAFNHAYPQHSHLFKLRKVR